MNDMESKDYRFTCCMCGRKVHRAYTTIGSTECFCGRCILQHRPLDDHERIVQLKTLARSKFLHVIFKSGVIPDDFKKWVKQ